MLPKRLNSHMAYLNYVKASSFMCGLRNSLGWGNSWGWCNRFGDNCFDGNSLINYTGFTGSIMTNTTSYVNAAAGYGNGANAQQTQGADGGDYAQMVFQLNSYEKAVDEGLSQFYHKYGVWPDSDNGEVPDIVTLKNNHNQRKSKLENCLKRDNSNGTNTTNNDLNAYRESKTLYGELSAKLQSYQSDMSKARAEARTVADKLEGPDDDGHYKGKDVPSDTDATERNKNEANRINNKIDQAKKHLGDKTEAELTQEVNNAKTRMEQVGKKQVTSGYGTITNAQGEQVTVELTAAEYDNEINNLDAWLKNLEQQTPVGSEKPINYDSDKTNLTKLITDRNTLRDAVNKQESINKAEADVSAKETGVKNAKKGNKKHKFARWWYDWTHRDSKDQKLIAAKGQLANSQNVLAQRKIDYQQSIFAKNILGEYGIGGGTYYNTP